MDQFGLTLSSDRGQNPFGADVSNLHLIHDYFHYFERRYKDDPGEPVGFFIGRFIDTTSTGAPDWRHVDDYIFPPGQDGVTFGRYTSDFCTDNEDVSTGHQALSNCGDVVRGNSISAPGPRTGEAADPFGSGWTAPRGARAALFNHEFQHALSFGRIAARGALPMDEVLSTGAEAIGGLGPRTDFVTDVPYTWSLNGWDSPTGDGCVDLVRVGRNVLGHRLFTAYLAYNFRGTDLSPEIPAPGQTSGFGDDLLWRWNRTNRLWSDLQALLTDANCAECQSKGYLQNLSAWERFQLIHHNWRVANYVNNSALAEGQYGYPTWSGFSPGPSVGAWQGNDGCPNPANPAERSGFSDDPVAIPPEVTARFAWASQETTIVGQRVHTYPNGEQYSYEMVLQPFGAEYWVVRSHPELASSAQELVIRIAPEGVLRDSCGITPDRTKDGRLIASVIGYSDQPDLLWSRPDLASFVIPPKFVDVDSTSGDIELVVPGFGNSQEAAVVAITLADGPSQGFIKPRMLENQRYVRALPYRISFGLRKIPIPIPFEDDYRNPMPVVETMTIDESAPTWSPTGNEIAFQSVSNAGLSQIHRKRLDLPGQSALFPQGANQTQPDWSPRGDWVAFAQDTVAAPGDGLSPPTVFQHIVAFNLATAEFRRLTSARVHDSWPAFEPNGRSVVYARFNEFGAVPGGGLGPTVELRRVGIDGTGDFALVVASGGGGGFRAPRWSADGQSVYFTRNDSLYSVGNTGGYVFQQGPSIGGRRVVSVDLPLGSGPLVADEIGQSVSTLPNSGCTGDEFRRLIVREQTSGDTQVRFYRSSARFFDPRWSRDGTRVVYASDQNGGPGRDLFVGQVGFNHPPTFNAYPTDRVANSGQYLDINLTATDPDGDPITYEGLYLPPGSYISGPAFYWPNVGPGGDYFVVFRAKDDAGGVANAVVRIQVHGPSGGGGPACPFVDTRSASGWEAENSILSRSLDGALDLDVYKLKIEPDTATGTCEIRIREDDQELTTLDQVRLLALDHDPALESFWVENRFVLGTRELASRITNAVGADVTDQVMSEAGYVAEAGDTLWVEFPSTSPSGPLSPQHHEPGHGPLPIVIPFDDKTGGKATSPPGDGLAPMGVSDASVLASTGVLVQAPDGSEGWRTVAQVYPRKVFDAALVDSVGGGPARLVFVGRHPVRDLARVIPSETLPGTTLDFLSARHTALGEVLPVVETADGVTTAVAPGDTLTMEFAVPSIASGKSRSWFLAALGVYTSTAPTARDEGIPPVPSGEPKHRFALGPARPNPTAGEVRFGFTVPEAMEVSIRVYDVAGRRVRSLVKDRVAAGVHEVRWDGRDDAGERIARGVYFYRMLAGSWRSQQKVVFLDR